MLNLFLLTEQIVNSSNQLLNWRDLRPELNIKSDINLLETTKDTDFFDLQPHAGAAIERFLKNDNSTLLLLKSEQHGQYAPLLENFIRINQPNELAIKGVKYDLKQADSFSFPEVSVEPAKSKMDNFAAKNKLLPHYIVTKVNCLVVFELIQALMILC